MAAQFKVKPTVFIIYIDILSYIFIIYHHTFLSYIFIFFQVAELIKSR